MTTSNQISASNLYWRLPDKEKKQFTLEFFGKNVSKAFRKYKSLFPMFFNKSAEEVAEIFCEQFFLTDYDEQISVYLANLSLNDISDRRITLSVRIPIHPIFNDSNKLPYNIAVSVIGYCPTSANNPIFIPERVFLTFGETEATTYEQEVLVSLKQIADSAYPPRSQPNLLQADFTKALPKFGVKTKERLNEWEKFLTFKQNLIKHKTQGVRYLRWEYKEDTEKGGRVEFFIIAESEDALAKARSIFRRQNMHVFDLKLSENPYSFNLPKNSDRIESAFSNLGQITNNNGIKVIRANNSNKELVDDCETLRQKLSKENVEAKIDFDFRQAVFAMISVDLSEEMSYRISQLEDDERSKNAEVNDEEKARTRDDKINQLFKGLPETGFLSISLLGDLALVNRHRRAVRNLMQNESCYAPYLSSYLFDIKNANQPDEIPEIVEWENKELNEKQKSAVQKMLAAPDICLIQGPPGTGKTTVIAEACLQFAKRGEKVLLASQAHDALDNALARLQNNPNLRALRLAKNQNRITDDGKEFTGDNLLNKHYEALQHHVEREYLAPQKEIQSQIDKRAKWLSEAVYVVDDLERLRKQYQENRDAIKNAEKKLKESNAIYTQQSQAFRQQQQTEQELQQLIQFLNSGEGNLTNLNLPLPESTYPLAKALCELQIEKIDQRFTYSTFMTEPNHQAVILGSTYSRWNWVMQAIPKMQADLERLKNVGDIQGLDTSTLLKIEAIEREIKEIENHLEKDEDNFELFKLLKQKERELKALKENPNNSKAGLTGNYYSLFSDEEYFIQNQNLTEVQVLLADRLNKLVQVKTRLESLIQQTIRQLEQQSIEQKVLLPSDQSVTDQQTELKSLKDELEKITEQGLQKNNQAKAMLQKGGFAEEEKLTERMAIEQQNLSELNRTLDEMKTKNQHFQSLFERWKAILTNSAKRAKSDWEELRQPYYDSCNLVAISCNEDEYTLTNLGFDSFDVVIIDEVSKATPLELLLPLMRGKKAILVGDHRQLPPVFNEADGITFEDEVEQKEAEEEENPNQSKDTDLTQENLRNFEKMVTASLFKELFEQAPESLRERLNIQFRMHPDIMKMINYFYEGQLECGNPDIQRSHGLEFKSKHNRVLGKDDHLLWIDTSDNEKGKRFNIDPGNNINLVEARIIARTLMDINHQTEIGGEYSKNNKLKIGVVSFYQPQCRVIRDEIRKLNNGQLRFSCIDVEINTVIRYQGKEKPIILLSLVKNDGKDHKEPIHAGRANVARFEFINVAMSRAQNLLLVFGARNMLENREVKLPRMDRQGYDKKMVYKKIFRYLELQAGAGDICTTQEFSNALLV